MNCVVLSRTLRVCLYTPPKGPRVTLLACFVPSIGHTLEMSVEVGDRSIANRRTFVQPGAAYSGVAADPDIVADRERVAWAALYHARAIVDP